MIPSDHCPVCGDDDQCDSHGICRKHGFLVDLHAAYRAGMQAAARECEISHALGRTLIDCAAAIRRATGDGNG